MGRPPITRPLRAVARALALVALLGAAACAAPNGATRATRAARVDAQPSHGVAAHAGHVMAAAASDAAAAPAPAAEGFSLYDLPSVWRDQRGAEVRLPSLAGKVRVVAMVYTSCEATCPLIVGDLKRVEAALPEARRDRVGFVLVSLDPARDTPGRLAAWAARTQLAPTRWTLLNGDADAVRELAATLGVRYQPQGDADLAHTNVITVLDASGAVVHQQLGLGADAGGTVAAVQRLLR